MLFYSEIVIFPIKYAFGKSRKRNWSKKFRFHTYPQRLDRLAVPTVDALLFDTRRRLRRVRLHIVSEVASHLVPHIPVNTSNHCCTCVGQMLSDWVHRLFCAPTKPDEKEREKRTMFIRNVVCADLRGRKITSKNLASHFVVVFVQRGRREKQQGYKHFQLIFTQTFFVLLLSR